jgi:hypothetical protein
MVTVLLSIIRQTLDRDSMKDREQLSFLSQLQIPSGLQVKNSGTNSILNLPQILKGFKAFWKNLINSSKFHLHVIYLNIILHGLTCIQLLEVSLQVVKMT